jgi:chemotaxis protein methyltransferase CheR
VLIYFTPAHAAKLVESLRHALIDEAWLAVSPSECSQALFRGFTAVNFPGSILYRKGSSERFTAPGWTAPPAAVTVPYLAPAFEVPPIASATAAAAVPLPDPLEVAESLYAQGRYAEAADTLQAARAENRSRAFSLLTRALANLGRLADALAWSERWIAADKMDYAAHYVHAMILSEQGEREAARHSLNRALYLEPQFALAHFALGNLARAQARSDANRHFDNALRLLRAWPPDQPLPESDGLGAGRLIEIITSVLALPERTDVIAS